MSSKRRSWVPLLAALLVALMLSPVAGSAATEPRLTTATIMVPAAAFVPTSNSFDYSNGGSDLSVSAGTANFLAELTFPVPVVTIRRITLYAYDNSASQVCVSSVRTRPAESATDSQSTVCTQNASAPQVVYTTAITSAKVNTGLQGAYLLLGFYGGGVQAFAVKVNYSY
jgi:hypothetical protein